MTVESLLIAKNRDKFSNLISFMRSMIVKNEVEADEVETTDTAHAYALYENAYFQRDSSLSYKLNKQDMLDFGFAPLDVDKYLADPTTFQTAYMRKNALCKSYMTKLRKQRVSEYVENNKYYRQFCGLPYDEEQYILVTNNDAVDPSDPEAINLHEVTLAKYPKTFGRLYYERDIELIYKKYDYLYLTFLEHPMTPYSIRSKEQFEICYYDTTLLDASELQYWFEVFNISRSEILEIDYIEAFQGNYKAYVNTMYLFILSYAFNLYCSKMLEKYAVRDYSDSEIYDILDSNGLGNLKSLNIALLRRLVSRLPDLRNYIGTNKVIDILFDIVADESLTIKRYYLSKKYKTNLNGDTNIDATQMYDDSVDLVFVEKTTNKGSSTNESIDVEYPYETVTMDDDTWGGTGDIEDKDLKLAVKEDIKRQLLAVDFNTIMTKYIGLTKIVDLYAKMAEVDYKLGLFFQFCKDINNIFDNGSITFDGMDTSPLCIYAAWCFTYRTLNELSDPDYIVSDTSILEGIMKLRTTDKLTIDAHDMMDISIDLGNGYERKLKDYFTEEELTNYLVSFNVNENSSISDLYSEYDKNYKIIKAIEDKIVNTYNYDEYIVWNTIRKANMTSHVISDLFGNAQSYSEYLMANDNSFFNHFYKMLGEADTKSKLINLNDKLYEAFSNYLKTATDNVAIYAVDEDDIVGGENLADISLLFNQFMSVYTQLYKQDSHVLYDNRLEDTLALLYATSADVFKTTDVDIFELVGKTLSDKFASYGIHDYLELLHFIKDTISSSDNFELILDVVEHTELRKFVNFEYLEFIYKLNKDIRKTIGTSDLSLSYELISDKIY